MRNIHLLSNLLVIFIVKRISCAYPLFDACTDLCKGTKLTTLDPASYEQVVCQRGCTFYQFDRCNAEVKFFPTKAKAALSNCVFKCGISCLDSYPFIADSSVCMKGCELIGNAHEDMVKDIIQDAEEEEKVLSSPEKDIDFDTISDPSIKNQLDPSGKYKIPETNIRTMPINNNTKEYKKDSGDWLDCASQNSGIPRWILLTSMLSAVFIALWLCFATEKKSCKERNISPILENNAVEETLPEKVPVDLEGSPMIIQNQVGFITPPPYVFENEKI